MTGLGIDLKMRQLALNLIPSLSKDDRIKILSEIQELTRTEIQKLRGFNE